MTAPITFRPPSALEKVWMDEMSKPPGNFVPTIKIIAVSVHQACIEIGRQFRIAKAQK